MFAEMAEGRVLIGDVDLSTLDEQIQRSLAQPRMYAEIAGLFAIYAATLIPGLLAGGSGRRTAAEYC